MLTHDEQSNIVGGDNLLSHLIDHSSVEHREHLLHHLPLHLDTGHRLSTEEVTLYFTNDGTVLLLVALVVGILHATEDVGLHTLNLTVGEAELNSRKQDAHGCIEAILPFVLAENDVEFKAFLSLADDVLAKFCTSLHKRRIGFLREFSQALIEGHGDDVLEDAGHIANLRKLDGIGQWVGLVHDSKDVVVLLGVAGYGHQRLLVVLYGEIHTFSLVLGIVDISPKGLNLLLYNIDIYIANDEYTLQVRTIPLVIVVAQLVVCKVINHRHQTNGQALSIAIAGDKLRKDGFVHTECGTGTCTPLFMNHTALLVNLVTIEGEVTTPIVKDEQTAINDAWMKCFINGHIGNVIDGLIDGCIGIYIGAELDTMTLQILKHTLVREVLGAVESHVLKEVSKTALALLFEYRANFLSNEELGVMLGQIVVTNVVSEAIRQLAIAHLRIHGQGWHLGHLLCHEGTAAESQNHQKG